MVKCILGGGGICDKLLSSENIANSAEGHCTRNGCKDLQIAAGPSSTLRVEFMQAAEGTDSTTSSCKQARTAQLLITQHIVIYCVQRP